MKIALIPLLNLEKNVLSFTQVWIWVPVVVTVFSGLIVVVPVVAQPSWGHLLATGIILLGLVFYIPLVHYKKVPQFLSKIQ